MLVKEAMYPLKKRNPFGDEYVAEMMEARRDAANRCAR